MPFSHMKADYIGSAGGKATCFKLIRDWLCSLGAYASTGAGWTLHDEIHDTGTPTNPAGEDFIVARSYGESGEDLMYCGLCYNGPLSTLEFKMYVSWDNVTHTGSAATSFTRDNFYINTGTSTHQVCCSGTLDYILLRETSTPSRIYVLGLMEDPVVDTTQVHYPSPLPSGLEDPITVTLPFVPASWYVGMVVYIRGGSDVSREPILAIEGNDVTIDYIQYGVTGPSIWSARDLQFAQRGPYYIGEDDDYKNTFTAAQNDECTNDFNVMPGTSQLPDPVTGEYVVGRDHINNGADPFAGTQNGATPGYYRGSTTIFPNDTLHTDQHGHVYRAMSGILIREA